MVMIVFSCWWWCLLLLLLFPRKMSCEKGEADAPPPPSSFQPQVVCVRGLSTSILAEGNLDGVGQWRPIDFAVKKYLLTSRWAAASAAGDVHIYTYISCVKLLLPTCTKGITWSDPGIDNASIVQVCLLQWVSAKVLQCPGAVLSQLLAREALEPYHDSCLWIWSWDSLHVVRVVLRVLLLLIHSPDAAVSGASTSGDWVVILTGCWSSSGFNDSRVVSQWQDKIKSYPVSHAKRPAFNRRRPRQTGGQLLQTLQVRVSARALSRWKKVYKINSPLKHLLLTSAHLLVCSFVALSPKLLVSPGKFKSKLNKSISKSVGCLWGYTDMVLAPCPLKTIQKTIGPSLLRQRWLHSRHE